MHLRGESLGGRCKYARGGRTFKLRAWHGRAPTGGTTKLCGPVSSKDTGDTASKQAARQRPSLTSWIAEMLPFCSSLRKRKEALKRSEIKLQ